MTFWIQASSPRVIGVRSHDDESLCDAAETTFALESELAYLNWNATHVPLSYKHDVGAMADDIVSMLHALRSHVAGRYVVEWASNTFSARWDLRWGDDSLSVAARWVSVVGGTEERLNARPAITLGRAAFAAEWGELLRRFEGGLRSAGYTSENLAGLERLSREREALPQRGVLYGG